MTATHWMYGTARPEQSAEPDDRSLAGAFHMLCTHLHTTRKETAPEAAGVKDRFPIRSALPSSQQWPLNRLQGSTEFGSHDCKQKRSSEGLKWNVMSSGARWRHQAGGQWRVGWKRHLVRRHLQEVKAEPGRPAGGHGSVLGEEWTRGQEGQNGWRC